MENLKGYKYLVEGHEDLEKLAKGILALTNLKSSRKDTILDIETIEDTWRVIVISRIELESYIKNLLGEVIDKEEIEILKIEFDDFKKGQQDAISYLWDNDKEYFITSMNSDL